MQAQACINRKMILDILLSWTILLVLSSSKAKVRLIRVNIVYRSLHNYHKDFLEVSFTNQMRQQTSEKAKTLKF